MKITDVGTAVVKGNFNWILVKVYTDEGVTGIGEAYWGAGVVDLIHESKSVIIGEDPLNINKCYERMVRWMSGAGSLAGATVTAISGIEIALWDLAGKILDTPVCNLFGGKIRSKVKLYVDCHAGEEYTPESYAKEALKVKKEGWEVLKFDIDIPTPYSNSDKTGIYEFWHEPYNRCLSRQEINYLGLIVEAIRESVGPEIDLAIDCHWKFPLKDAIDLVNRLEGYDLLWVEDPIPPENIDAFKELCDSTNVPLATGENFYRIFGFRDLIEKQACRIVTPDIPKMGGLLEARKVFDLASMYYLPVAPHNVCSPVGTLATVQLCAAMPNFLVMEFHARDVSWWDDLIVKDGPLIENGYIKVPERPGLGFELNESVVKKHLVENKNFFNKFFSV